MAQGKKNIADLTSQLEKEKTQYKPSDYRMQFISNHDENTWKGTVFERLGDAVKTFAVLSATIPGMPLIYNGQEACMDKRLRFFDKDTIDWAKDCCMDELYATLLKLKDENQALWNGEFGGDMQRIFTTADDKIFAFSRTKDKYKVITILNLSADNVEFEFTTPVEEPTMVELFTNELINSKYNLKGWEYRVYKSK